MVRIWDWHSSCLYKNVKFKHSNPKPHVDKSHLSLILDFLNSVWSDNVSIYSYKIIYLVIKTSQCYLYLFQMKIFVKMKVNV